MRELVFKLTFWGSLAGAGLLLFGHPLAAAIAWTAVGWGGMGIVYGLISQYYRGSYSDIRALLDVIGDLRRGRHRPELRRWAGGVLMHLPQALAGIALFTWLSLP